MARYAGVDATGTGEYRGVIQALDAFGAVVPGGSLSVDIDGELVEVDFDAYGYGSLPALPEPGVAHVTAAGIDVRLHGLAVGWEVDLHPSADLPVTEVGPVAPLSRGVLVASGDTVWWAGGQLPSHPVLAAGSPIGGLVARHVDVDGILDAVAWTGTHVFVLRGRAEGGVSFGVAWAAEGYRAQVADAGDLNGDRLADLAMVWVDDAGGVLVDVWESDGLLGFTPAAVAEAPTNVRSMAIQDATARGQAQLTLLAEDATSWARFVRAGHALVPIGPDFPELESASGAALLSTGDLNGDSGDELVIVGRRGAVSAVDVLIDENECALGIEGAQCGVEVTRIAQGGAAGWAAGDGNGDRIDDLWFVDEYGVLMGSFWLTPIRERRVAPVLPLPAAGTVGVRALGAGVAPELVLAAPGRLWEWRGQSHPNDTLRMWTPTAGEGVAVRENVSAHFAVVELDADPTTNELVVLTTENNDTRLKVLQYAQDGSRAGQLGAIRLTDQKLQPDDLVMCGDFAWFALDGRAWRIDVSQPDVPSLGGLPAGNGVTRVDCADVGGALHGVFLEPDVASIVRISGSPPEGFSVPGAIDVVLIEADGDPTAVTCDTPGCALAAWSEGGLWRVAEAGPTGIRVGGDQVGARGGWLTLADVDGDDWTDLLAARQDGTVIVHRSAAGEIAPAQLPHHSGGLRGPVQLADADNDGTLDLWMVDADGTLRWDLGPALTPSDVGPPTRATSGPSGTGLTVSYPTAYKGPSS